MSFPKGAMLQVPIQCALDCADHIGVYVGEGLVIHFGWPIKDEIVKTSLLDFAGGIERIALVTVKQSPQTPAEADAVCRIAEALYLDRNNDFNKRYNVVLNNCEDFARECYKNASVRPPSQVQKAAVGLLGTALLGIAAFLIGRSSGSSASKSTSDKA